MQTSLSVRERGGGIYGSFSELNRKGRWRSQQLFLCISDRDSTIVYIIRIVFRIL